MYISPLDAAKRAIDTMMRKFDAADLPPKGRFHYHQGVFLSGVYETYLLTGEKKYFDYMRAYVDSLIGEDGSVGGHDAGQLDDIQPGILLYPLYALTKDEKYKKALDFLVNEEWNHPRTPEGGFWHKTWYPNQMWLDGLYMGGPIMAQYAKEFGRTEFYELVEQQAVIMEKRTRDPETGLLYHAWDYSKEAEWADKETGLSPEFWGRSIGWVGVAILNDLDFFPKDSPAVPVLKDIAKRLMNALIPFQSADGRWYQVVNKPDAPDNWLENSCSCLYTAALAKGVYTGVLPASMLENAKRGYKGVIESIGVDENGGLQIGSVCVGTGVGNYTHYINRPTSVNDLHGVGAFLIMCAECARAGIE